MAKGDGAAGHNIDKALYAPEKRKPITDKLGSLPMLAAPQDGCVPDTTPCGACAGCRRRASVRVVGEALETDAHEPWTLEETGRVLMALGLKLDRQEAA